MTTPLFNRAIDSCPGFDSPAVTLLGVAPEESPLNALDHDELFEALLCLGSSMHFRDVE